MTELIDYDQFCGITPPSEVGPSKSRATRRSAIFLSSTAFLRSQFQELKRRLDAKEDIFVLDVREPHEYQIVNLGAPLIPVGDIERRSSELADKKDREIVVHCKSGARSQRAAVALKQAGFTNVSNLTGGILAWADKIDPSLPKY